MSGREAASGPARTARTAAGIGNTATQSGLVKQFGGGGPLGDGNIGNMQNLSAGIGNLAKQKAFIQQR
ncbi:hypothetical protein [Azospirillum doebereinerae]